MLDRTLILAVLLAVSSMASGAEQECEHPMNIKIKGSISEEDVLNTIKPAISQIEQCYNKLLSKDKSASGRVSITSYIQQNGSVEKVEICTTEKLDNKRLKGCIKRRMKRLTYPKGMTPSEVLFPIDLTPQ